MDNVKRGKPSNPAARAELLEREAELIKLRRGGLTWDIIAERTGYSSGLTARNAYERAMQRFVVPDVNEIRTLETERLDMAQAAIWGKVLQGDNASIQSLLRIMERRAKLLGLDQPVKIQAEVMTYDTGNISDYLRELAVGIANRNAQGELAVRNGEAGTDTDGE